MSNKPVDSAAKIPNLPVTQISDPQLRPVVDALRTIFNTRAFNRDPLEKWVTWRDLVDSNVVKYVSGNSTLVGSAGSGFLALAPGDSDLTPPPAPTGLVASGAFNNIILDWDEPGLKYSNHAYTEIWRSGTNERSDAVLIGTAPGAVYVDPVANSSTYYYWIKFVSQADVRGPFNSLVGVQGETATDPTYALEVLTGQITESQLFQSLGERIDLIDAPSSVTGSVNARVAAEAAARAAAIQAEATARAQGLLDEANARSAEITTERNAREQAVLAESLARTAAINAEAQARADDLFEEAQIRAAAVTAEANARQAADSSLASQITTVSSNLNTVNSTLTAAIQAETTARSTAISAEASARDTLAAQLRGTYAGNDLSQVTTGLLYSERQARVTADDALSTRIDTIVAASSGDFQDLFAAIAQEETARIAGDTANATSINTLQSRLDNVKNQNGVQTNKSLEATLVDNKQAQVDGDAALSSSISSLSSTVTNNYNTLNSAITTESTTRANAISAEATARTTLATQLRGNYTGTDVAQVSGGLIYSERIARVAADSSLQTQINSLSASTTTADQNLTAAIQAEQTARTNAIAAEAASRETLATQMRGTYTGTDITQLTSGLLFNERQARSSQDSALASSISALSATVTSNYNTLNSAITTEQTARADGDSALTTSLNALSSTVTNNYSALNSAITSEASTRASADTALTNSVNSLSATVTSNYNTLNAAITNETTARANADSALTTQINTVSAAATKTRTYRQAAAPTSGMVTGDLWFDSDDNNKAYRYTGTAWEATDDLRLAANAAAIQTEATTRANADSSLASQITTVQATANVKNRVYRQASAPTTGLTAGDLWFDSDDNNKPYRYTGSAWEATEDLRIQANAVAIQTEATARANADNSLFAQYTVKIDTNGYVSGFGLASTATTGVPFSDFIIRADKFSIASPSGPGLTPIVPFVVNTTTQTVNGVAVPPGIYMDAAFIKNGTISNAKIATAAIDSAKIADAAIGSAKIADASITNAKIVDATITGAKIGLATITAANILDAAITNAKIANAAINTAKIADASITDAKIVDLNATKITAGTIDAARIGANTITADKIDSRNLTIKDSSGNIVFSSGEANAGKFGNPSNMIPDDGFYNPGHWRGDSNQTSWPTGFVPTSGSGQPVRRFLLINSSAGTFDLFSNYWAITQGKQYRIRLWMYMSPDFNGFISPSIHLPNVDWVVPGNRVADPNGQFPAGHTGDSWGRNSWVSRDGVWTAGATIAYQAQTRIAGRITAGYCEIYMEMIPVAESIINQGAFATLSQINPSNVWTYIANGAIQNAHIANAAITSAKIGVAEIDTLRIAGNSVTVSTSVSTNAEWSSLYLTAPYGGVINIVAYVDSFSYTPNYLNVYVNGGLVVSIVGTETYNGLINNSVWTPATGIAVVGVGGGTHHVQVWNMSSIYGSRPSARVMALLTQR